MQTSRLTLLFLTDLSNEAEEEDIIISNYLRKNFEVIICHPNDCESIEDSADAIIIRNTWNDALYGQSGSGYYERFRTKKLPVHDYLYTYPGEPKDYLIHLFSKGFPVIPSIDTAADIEKLPKTDSYFIKPKNGYSAIGARKLSRDELLAENPAGNIIQPYIDFEYELSFYYLDKELQHALYAPDPSDRWNLVEYHPSEADIAFADMFVAWNPQKYGIERIDACRLKDGRLLLMEITDQGGTYLSIPKLPENLKLAFLENLSASIRQNASRNRT
jgi:hypothetical protein